MLIHARHFKSKRRREIFFIAEHHVNVRRNPAVYLLRGFLSSMGLPQRSSVIQIIGNGRTVPLCCLHRFQGNFRRSRRERTKNAASVEPARTMLSKNLVPIDFSWLQLRNGSVPAVITSDC